MAYAVYRTIGGRRVGLDVVMRGLVYAAFALRVWLSSATRSAQAKRFAKWSTIGALALGAAGQVAYHLMTSAGMTAAPWWITTFVSCLPVVVLGCAAALTHLLHDDTAEEAQR